MYHQCTWNGINWFYFGMVTFTSILQYCCMKIGRRPFAFLYFIDFDRKVINQYFSLNAYIEMKLPNFRVTDITIFYRNRYTIKRFTLISCICLAIPFYSVLVWDFLSSTHHASTFYQAFVSIFTLLYSTHGPTHILSHTLIYLIAYLLCRRMIEN